MEADQQERMLHAFAWMCVQYIGGIDHKTGRYLALDHVCMNAGENAIKLLVEHGLVEPSGRGGEWTEKGIALLNKRI